MPSYITEGGKEAERVIYGDNTAALAIVQSPSRPWRTRHLRLPSNVLRERVREGEWQIRHLPGSGLVADYLTKAVAARTQWLRFYAMAGRIKEGSEVVSLPGPGEADGGRVIGKEAAVKVAAMSGLMGIIACWKPQDRGSCLIRDVCSASLGVGVGFVLKGQWAQPERESRSARENEPAAHEDNQIRVAKMVREDEPTTSEDPSVWRSASVREHEPTEKKIVRENEPATTRGLGKMNQPQRSTFGTPPVSRLTTAPWAAPCF